MGVLQLDAWKESGSHPSYRVGRYRPTSHSVALATFIHSGGRELACSALFTPQPQKKNTKEKHKRKNDPAVLFQPGRSCSALTASSGPRPPARPAPPRPRPASPTQLAGAGRTHVGRLGRADR